MHVPVKCRVENVLNMYEMQVAITSTVIGFSRNTRVNVQNCICVDFTSSSNSSSRLRTLVQSTDINKPRFPHADVAHQNRIISTTSDDCHDR